MLIKAGVDISRLRPEIRKRLNGIAYKIAGVVNEELIITSTCEGNHSAGSLHYANLAIDIRRTNKPDETCLILRQYLGKDYDVLLGNDHIHIEYDPK